MKYLLSFVLILLFIGSADGQARLKDELAREYLEEIISSLDEEDIQDIEYIVQLVGELIRKPLDINKNDLTPFADAGMLTNEQVLALQDHIDRYGPLLSIYELQTVALWDLRTIRRIQPMIKVRGDIGDIQGDVDEILKNATLSVRTYLSRDYPKSKGYFKPNDSTDAPYEGDPLRNYIMMRAQYQYRFSVGMVAEKDEGEALFRKSNDTYDYVSMHAYGQSINRYLNIVALGDYKVNMGQGLVLHNGFGGNKSAYVTNIKKGGKIFRPHASTSEINYFRGGAAEFRIAKDWYVAAFYSNIKRDANIVTDSIDDEVEITQFTSLQSSGLHRTKSEIEDERQIRYQAYGGRVGVHKRKYSIHLNVLQSDFDKPYLSNISPYNQYRFRGTSLLNSSLDYAVTFGGVHVFGESAMSDNGAMAHLIGMKAGLSKQLNWVALYRNYARDYQTIQSNAFGESSTTENEIGIYNGIEYIINQKFQVYGYADFWTNPWLRYNVDAPAGGKEYVFKFRFYKKRRLETYVQYKYEEKSVASDEETPFSQLELRKRNQLRLHFNYKITPSMEWRSRVELNHVAFSNRTSDGYLLFQDIIFKPIQFPLSFTTRYAFFDTDDYDSRIYMYENHLLYNYSLPAFSGTGHRFYFNLRYRPIRPLTLEFRIDQTIYTNRDEIGSGTELRSGNSTRQLAFQVQYVFGR